MTLTSTHWDNFVAANQGHLLQSWAWGELKRDFGWTPVRILSDGGGAQILFRRLPLGLTIAYIPKGPLVDWSDRPRVQAFFSTIHSEAKKRRAVFLKVEPDLCRGDAELAEKSTTFFQETGFRPANTIQPQTSLVVDISGDEDAILGAMKQKTRYNVRLAKRKGVVVRQGTADDISIFHQLALTTADRNDFGIHSLAYYRTAYDLFAPADQVALFLAEVEAEPISALIAFRQGETAYYFYGASSNKHRNLMAPYLVQWAAIRWAKARGCRWYDLWGVPDADPATLEAEFQARHDGLWGVYRFKRGFGGQFVQSIGAFDTVYNPLLYRLYQFRRNF